MTIFEILSITCQYISKENNQSNADKFSNEFILCFNFAEHTDKIVSEQQDAFYQTTRSNSSENSFFSSSRNEGVMEFNSERYQLTFTSPVKATRALLHISSN